MSFGQSEETKAFDRAAWAVGRDNAESGRDVFDGLRFGAAAPTNLDRALCTAGFEQTRIEKGGLTSYPVLIYTGRRRYWLVARDMYQATMDATPPTGEAGYANLRSLWRLKGEIIR